MLPTFHSDSVHGNEHKFQCALRQQEKDLSNTFNDGIIISNQSLVITNVKRSQMGQYTCIASNSEGEGESNQALLEIQCKQKQQSYGNTANAFRLITLEIVCFFSLSLSRIFPQQTVAPLCRPGQVQTYNVGRGETAQIQCEVEGIPRDINFVWRFNTSVSEVLDMPSSIVKNNSTKSTIHFKPMTEHVMAIRMLNGGHRAYVLSWRLIVLDGVVLKSMTASMSSKKNFNYV